MRGSFHRFTHGGLRPASRRLGAALAAMLWLAAAPALASRPSLTDVRIGVHKDFTRVVLQTDAAVHARVHESAREIRIRLDATSKPRAVTARSHQLTWVKVEPVHGGSEVKIQLRGPATLKRMVLHKPDRLVLDVYPARHAAATPAPSKPAPTAGKAAPTPAPAPETAAAGSAAGSTAAPGGTAPPPKTSAPAEAPAPTPSEAPSPSVASPGGAVAGEAAGAPAVAGSGPEESGTPPAPTSPPPEARTRPVPQPIPPPRRGAGAGRGPLDFLPPPFNQPITLGLIAVLLFLVFVWLRVRRRRVAEAVRSPFPPEEEAEIAPEEEAGAGEEAPLLGGLGSEAPTPPGPVTVPPPSAPPPRPSAPLTPAAAGAAVPGAGQPQGELERRVAHLEGRLEELLDSKERLERQVAAQTEELRVQRAAIARTQRVLRTIARPEDEATEPAPKT